MSAGDNGVAGLAQRLATYVDINIERVLYFIAEHPDLGRDDRAALVRGLRENAAKLMKLAQRLEAHEMGVPRQRGGRG